MRTRNVPLYESAPAALVRAARHARLTLPPWPEGMGESLDEVEQRRAWLMGVWAVDEVSEVIEQASPALARYLESLSSAPADAEPRQVRRAMVSVIRYVQRMTGRATPNGLFAGVAAAGFGEPEVRWGPWHWAVARAGAAWISSVVEQLESDPGLLGRLPLVAGNSAFVRGERLVVPYPPRAGGDGNPTAEITLRYTSAVRAALDAAQAPVPFDAIVGKTSGQFPGVPAERVRDLVASLLRNGVLISSLRAPSTAIDPLDHVVAELESVRAADVPSVAPLVADLRAVRDGVRQHNHALSPPDGRRLRRALHAKMGEIFTVEHPLVVDLRVDCSLVLPAAVAREAEKAATALALLTPAPFGTPGWKDFQTRFFEKYGIGSFVPLKDVTDPDVGLGFPAGYLDAAEEPREPLSDRELRLLALAQAAVLDGRDEVRLDDEMIADLRGPVRDGEQPPPHFELSFQVSATSTEAMARGEFTLSGMRPSRGVGTVTGRFLPLLRDDERGRFADLLRDLPRSTPGALPAQLSLGPLDRHDADVTRVPDVLGTLISLGEHRASHDQVISLDDLAVGCDRRRLYLVSVSRRRVVEPHLVHALDLRAHTPPLGRFLAEISRTQSMVITAFPWGAAANTLPFLPRVRYGRTVLSPARWLLFARELPASTAPWWQWHAELEEWLERRRVPHAVALTEGDQLLHLDLSTSAHCTVLRSHLTRAGSAVLTETFPVGDWFDGRAHDVVVPMTAKDAPHWPAVPPVTESRLLSRDHGHLPGTPPWLLVKLYGHPERHPQLLGSLPALLARWDTPPAWWFMRYRDPLPHLRLRIAVPDADAVGPAVTRISDWAAGLRRAGLVNDVLFATTYPETGRWGTGIVMRLAEDVFAADSSAVAVQLAQPDRPEPRALAVANFVSLTTAFTGSVPEAMAWLSAYGDITDRRQPLDRTTLRTAVHLADPTDDWAALREQPGGTAIVTAWAARDEAIAHYRAHLSGTGLDPDLVLDSLLHTHHIRAAGIDRDDERMCVRLARAAASAWSRRPKENRGAA